MLHGLEMRKYRLRGHNEIIEHDASLNQEFLKEKWGEKTDEKANTYWSYSIAWWKVSKRK